MGISGVDPHWLTLMNGSIRASERAEIGTLDITRIPVIS